MFNMPNNSSRNSMYDTLLRVAAIGCAAVMIVLSIEFSKRGFAFWQPEDAWMGYALAIMVGILEFAFNRGTRNPTLFFICVVAYAYGVYTNIAGLFTARYQDPAGMAMDVIFSVIAGLLLELAPEPLMLWGLNLERPGDGFISQLLGLSDQIDLMRRTQSPNAGAGTSNFTPPFASPATSFRPPAEDWQQRREAFIAARKARAAAVARAAASGEDDEDDDDDAPRRLPIRNGAGIVTRRHT